MYLFLRGRRERITTKTHTHTQTHTKSTTVKFANVNVVEVLHLKKPL
jgi:hypothetical protein